MASIIIGSLLLSIVHIIIPNHWLPIVVIAKSEKWKNKDLYYTTLLASLSHSVSTIGLGVFIGLVGLKLSQTYEMVNHVIAPLILIFMGLIYFGLSNSHEHHDHFPHAENLHNKPKKRITFTLIGAMFLSPCLEIETYFFQAGTFGFQGIFIVSLIYLLVSTFGMLGLVNLARKGFDKFNLHFLEENEKKITGIILILLGLVGFFIAE